MDSWLILSGDKGSTKIQISAQPVIESRTCDWKAEILILGFHNPKRNKRQ